MIYNEVPPARAAQEFVKCFWILEDDQPSSNVQRILPDGRCELILNFGDPFENLQGADWKTQPRWFLTGQITRPFKVRPRGRSRILGIRFHPHGASQIFGLPIQDLTDRTIALDELSNERRQTTAETRRCLHSLPVTHHHECCRRFAR